jgi:hypothetical protein
MEHINSLEDLEKSMAIKVNVFNSTSLCLRSTLEALKDAERHNFRLRKMKKHKIGGIQNEKEIHVKKRRLSDIVRSFRNLMGLE